MGAFHVYSCTKRHAFLEKGVLVCRMRYTFQKRDYLDDEKFMYFQGKYCLHAKDFILF